MMSEELRGSSIAHQSTRPAFCELWSKRNNDTNAEDREDARRLEENSSKRSVHLTAPIVEEERSVTGGIKFPHTYRHF
jgi:hypothetical protein